MKYLLQKGYLDGSCLTVTGTLLQHFQALPHAVPLVDRPGALAVGRMNVACLACERTGIPKSEANLWAAARATGKTLAENLEGVPDLKEGQQVIMPLEQPIKASGHLQVRVPLQAPPHWRYALPVLCILACASCVCNLGVPYWKTLSK